MSKAAEQAKGGSAMNAVFVFFVAGAIVFAAVTEPGAGVEPSRMKAITDASFEAAKSAVTLALGLIGIMALWLGLVRVLEAGGLMYALAKAMRPLMQRLFPDVPPTHPAMGAMLLNMSANTLGLGNAATPFGLKAMTELNKLNPIKGTATNAMCLFLAINTSSVTILPLGVIGVRAAAGSSAPAAIFLPTLIATITSTAVAIIVATLLARRDRSYASGATPQDEAASDEAEEAAVRTEADESYDHLLFRPSTAGRVFGWGGFIVFSVASLVRAARSPDVISFFANEFPTYWLMPMLMLLIVSYGMARGVKVYEAVTEGAKQGFDIAVRIIPFLVAILVAIGMFRASGALDLLASMLGPVTQLIGMPPETLPMALIRSLSGSGAFGIMSALIQEDPNSYQAFVASTMMGSTETTFYVLAVYFGSVGIVRIRHALVAALCADVAGLSMACIASSLFWQG